MGGVSNCSCGDNNALGNNVNCYAIILRENLRDWVSQCYFLEFMNWNRMLQRKTNEIRRELKQQLAIISRY